MDGYNDLTDEGLDKLDRTEGRIDGWTDMHVTYINRSTRVARVCVCVCLSKGRQLQHWLPTVYTAHCIIVNSGERERQIPIQVKLPFFALKKKAKERFI